MKILDFGASPETIPSGQFGKRVLVDKLGDEIEGAKGHVDLND
jgi:hypothetical protein